MRISIAGHANAVNSGMWTAPRRRIPTSVGSGSADLDIGVAAVTLGHPAVGQRGGDLLTLGAQFAVRDVATGEIGVDDREGHGLRIMPVAEELRGTGAEDVVDRQLIAPATGAWTRCSGSYPPILVERRMPRHHHPPTGTPVSGLLARP